SEAREVELFRGGEFGTLNGQSLATLTIAFRGTSPPARGSVTLTERRSGEVAAEELSGKAFFEFRQKFRPGDYEVGVLNAYGFFIESISYNGAPVANKMVRIRGTEPANLTITLQRGKSRIEGLVLSGSKPARGVMVVLIPEASLNAPASFRRAQSNTDGSFAFAMVTPGK